MDIGGFNCVLYAINDELLDLPNSYSIKAFQQTTKGEKLFAAIYYYRELLSNPIKTQKEKTNEKILGELLYDFLIAP